MTAVLHWLVLLFSGPKTEVDEYAKAELKARVDDHERRLKRLEREKGLFKL